MVDSMQLMRIGEHPIGIGDNLIIYDDLEHGTLRIYEQTEEGPVTVQQLAAQFMPINNAVLLGEVVINSNRKEDDVFIHKISCNFGYENLVAPMLYQILHFASFCNQYETVSISDREYERWRPYAKDAFSDFQKVNRIYEHYLDGHTTE